MKKEVLEKICNARKNLIVTGDVSIGKTSKVIIPLIDKMIDNNESLFVLDSKKEYINKYYKKLKENNYNVIILNLKDLDKSDSWNPLEYPYCLYKNGNKDEAMDYIEKLGKEIISNSTESDPFWSSSAIDFFIGLTLGLFEDGKKEEINLCSINHMFDGINNKFGNTDYITNYFQCKDPNDQSYIYASTTFLAPKETKGGIVSVARQKIKSLVSREKLSILLNKSSFNINEINNKKTALFFIGREDNKQLNKICSILMDQLYNVLSYKQYNNKFNFIFDNFDTLDYVNGFTDTIESSVSRNIKFVIVTRYIDILKEKYSDYLLKLCDVINVDNKDISIKVNNEELIEQNIEIPKNEESLNNIIYPVLDNNKPLLFDLEGFVCNKKKEKLSSNEIVQLDIEKKDNLKVDDLLQRIDAKIAELEKEEG